MYQQCISNVSGGPSGASLIALRLLLLDFSSLKGLFFRQLFSAEEHLFSRMISGKMIIFPFYSQVKTLISHLLRIATFWSGTNILVILRYPVGSYSRVS